MPWSAKEAQKFKKGLSIEQAEKWAEIANSVLKKCRDEGGEDCEEKAIRIANDKVGVNMENKKEEKTEDVKTNSENQWNSFTANISGYNIRYFENQEYYVAPVVMITEGVHSGSKGPTLYTNEELRKFASAWNGRPLPLGHPSENGKYVTANTPEQIEKSSIGWLFNVEYVQENERGKLRGEAWVNVAKSGKKAPALLQKMKNNEMVEVSTAMWSDDEHLTGNWEGEEYSMVAHNLRPDHLAILLDKKGACSIEDGAGLMRNTKIDDLAVNLKAYNEFFELLSNEYDGDVLIDEIDDKNKQLRYRVVIEDDVTVFQCGYDIQTDDRTIQLSDAVPVHNVINKNKNGGEPQMGKVDKLIQNKETKWSEDDREFLNGLEENQLDKMFPTEKTPVNEDNGTEDVSEVNEKKSSVKEDQKPVTCEDFIAKAPEGIRQVLQQSLNDRKAEHDKMVAALEKNERCVYSLQELKAKENEELKKLLAFAGENEDYSLSGDGVRANAANEDDAVPQMPKLFQKKEG